MGYSPRQPRGPDGRWIARGARGAVRALNITTKPAAPVRRRGSGISGLRRNTVPYVRVNKRGSTVGINTGTKIPSSSLRVALGGYARVESAGGKTAVDRFVDKAVDRVFPKGKKRGKAVAYLRKTTKFVHRGIPGIRGSYGGVQARIGTSRRAGPTLIVRRGKQKSKVPPHNPMSSAASRKAIHQYDRRMNTIAGERARKKRYRPQRRRAARKKKN